MSLIRDGDYKPLNRSGRILALFFGPWGIPLLLLLGWGPLLADQFLANTFGDPKYTYAAFGLLWGLTLTLITTLSSILLLLGHGTRFVARLGRGLFSRNRY
jgi:hypothetical protein